MTPADRALIAKAAAAPTPRHAVAVLYPGWGLVADGGHYHADHHFIVHAGNQWVAATVRIKDRLEDRYWADLDIDARASFIREAITTQVTATGTAEDLFNAITAAADGQDKPALAELGATVLGLLDDTSRTAHLTLLALGPTDSLSFNASLFHDYQNITKHRVLPMYRHYTPSTEQPVTTETAAQTITYTVHSKFFRPIDSDDDWSPWTPGQSVHLPDATAYVNHARTVIMNSTHRLQLRDPDGNVLDEVRPT